MLTIENACKQFGKSVLFQNLCLQVEKGSVIGLAGPSGCGKTTLLRCIQQLESLDEGQIHLQGKSGFMFQDFQLFPHMTVLKNLTYAPSLYTRDLSKCEYLHEMIFLTKLRQKMRKSQPHCESFAGAWAEKASGQSSQFGRSQVCNLDDPEKQAFSLLEQLGIAEKSMSYPAQLSGGQKQRAALARSLMMQPDLLLCDEPTSGLDQKSIEDVIALVQKVQNMGITLIIASHDLDFLGQIADKMILFQNQTIIET